MRDTLPEVAKEVERLRTKSEQLTTDLRRSFVQGRLRTDRSAPSANTNVIDGDRLGDIVRTGTYEYLLVDASGTLKWARQPIDTTW